MGERIVNKNRFDIVMSYLPDKVSFAVSDYLGRVNKGKNDVNEIRLRAFGPLALVVSGENASLGVSVGKEQIKETFKKVCDGAVFAHRDEMCQGFISLAGGVRVGVSGLARYDGGCMVGIGDISSLVFRIPTGECSFVADLYSNWLTYRGGMLICSRAGEGKTTAIRSLARLIGSGKRACRVVVVDERCEFDPEDYTDSHVDILRGYKRALGVDIAVRTMSAQVLIVDEISSREDAAAMLSSLGAGIEVIATVHAPDLESAMKRDYVRELVKGGLFNSAVLVSRCGTRYSFRMEKIKL